ncbi:MAG: carboxypeptidase-like regulatory domain-containing protein [bacterium]|nr:carboxypeptidase-like regulatory domain-containing protein [bacterium]
MSRNIFLSLILCVIGVFTIRALHSDISYLVLAPPHQQTIWKYQCIDTMKYSRDRARAFSQGKLSTSEVTSQVEKIASLGANCISIGTPYDSEFLPYLSLWVKEARTHNLKVWFRGNWAGYEGWFEYPKLVSLDEHHTKTKNFIIEHKDLFESGDIFTPAPEPENSPFFKPLFEKEPALFRSFISQSSLSASSAFKQIDRDVHTEFTSLSGGVATYALDKETVSDLNNTVTLDHYVSSPEEMDEYISRFNSLYGAQIALGEFGAPIPDINGAMTDEGQAKFVNSLLQTLTKRHSLVPAINYWTLSDASTALLDTEMKEKPVAKVLREYYKPIVVYGSVENIFGFPVPNARIVDQTRTLETTSDARGYFSILLPNKGSITLQVNAPGSPEQIVTINSKNPGLKKMRVKLQ